MKLLDATNDDSKCEVVVQQVHYPQKNTRTVRLGFTERILLERYNTNEI